MYRKEFKVERIQHQASDHKVTKAITATDLINVRWNYIHLDCTLRHYKLY